MAATTRMPPVLARRAHKVDQIVFSSGGARRMRAVGGIPVIAAEGRVERRGEALPFAAESGSTQAPCFVPQPFQLRPGGIERGL